MADLTVEAVANRAIEESGIQMTLEAAEDMLDGVTAVYVDANGKFAKANAGTGGNNAAWGVIAKAVRAGYPVTAVRQGVIHGVDLSGLAFGDEVFLSNTAGKLADAAGTVSIQIGRVIPIAATGIGSAPDKALAVELAGS